VTLDLLLDIYSLLAVLLLALLHSGVIAIHDKPHASATGHKQHIWMVVSMVLPMTMVVEERVTIILHPYRS
jgi:hypothetical protein